MDTIGICLNGSITTGLVVMAWVMQLRFGPAGFLGHHLLTLPGWMIMAQVALAFGIWPDYDILTTIGCLFQVLLFNSLLLPVSITTLISHAINC